MYEPIEGLSQKDLTVGGEPNISGPAASRTMNVSPQERNLSRTTTLLNLFGNRFVKQVTTSRRNPDRAGTGTRNHSAFVLRLHSRR